MIQVYVAVGGNRRVTVPAAVCKALGVKEHEWLRMTVLDDGRALLEPVPSEVPSTHLIRGAAAVPTRPDSDARA